MPVYRIYVEKKKEHATEAQGLLNDIKASLGLTGLTGLRVINRYDVEGITRDVFDMSKNTIFSEPQVDVTYDTLPQLEPGQRMFATEYLPGQFDQRADSCSQCIQLLAQGDRPVVRTARIILLTGELSDEEFSRIVSYCINPVEAREASFDTFDTLDIAYDIPTEVDTLNGFNQLDEAGLAGFVSHYGLAMDLDDIKFCQDYFKNTEHRDPTITEIRMIDTYWSDHCRHTTFLTNIDQVNIVPTYIQDTYQEYLDIRKELYIGRNKPITLMDIATIGAKKLKAMGKLPDLDESEEINACSVKIKVDVDGELQDWLLMFKNETHNHPTEIEPFGGAATCLGGAIRDPLSGRSYVYQAMRVTGAANPLRPFNETLKGKLPQKKLVTTAANGYSSYGNQIGLATGHVHEIYHEGYAAKRLEIGAVMGATPMENVRREVPSPGDVIILLGGKTGRDGCGGATGSSKSHTLQSLETCGAEVQKGNAPEERKLQRLFRDKAVTSMIKRCNDFGAGGVSVAIGELADGLTIDLNKVPKKYDGLDGTELAISESQERMAVVVAKEDTDRFIELARRENLMATPVAVVTDKNRLEMLWNGKVIVNLSRDFLNSNGASKHTDITVGQVKVTLDAPENVTADTWVDHLSSLACCSQKGLIERFDSTIGAGTVLMPFGGKYQLTPNQAMAAKIPVLHGDTKTVSLMGWGFNPLVSQQSPYHGAACAVVESVAKVVAASGDYRKCWLTFQEYFERTQGDPARWGQPFSALLGALKAQLELGIGAIGGKDSMSGTFEHIDVPPTLVSFAVSVTDTDHVVSPEFKAAGDPVVYLAPAYDENGMPCFDSVKETFSAVTSAIREGKIKAAWSVANGGVAEGIAKMCLGNKLGFQFDGQPDPSLLFVPVYGSFILELQPGASIPGAVALGQVTDSYTIATPDYTVCLDCLQKAWEDKLEPVFPVKTPVSDSPVPAFTTSVSNRVAPALKVASPRVLIPVFPGTNCEYDTAKMFEKYGAIADVFVVNTLSGDAITQSVAEFAKRIDQSQIIMIPGGFSGGDEPEGSGKFITAFFRNPSIKESVHNLLKNRDGLMLGICNGFQALIKLGLVPYGEIIETNENCPTLTFNRIGRHQSMLVHTRIASNKSPWLALTKAGDIHTVPISHGEGRFAASEELARKLAENGQIATQYCDLEGNPTMDYRFNPNGSVFAIEGITSPDGRILGKMAHSERIGNGLYQNVPGEKDQLIFKAGVEYFK